MLFRKIFLVLYTLQTVLTSLPPPCFGMEKDDQPPRTATVTPPASPNKRLNLKSKGSDKGSEHKGKQPRTPIATPPPANEGQPSPLPSQKRRHSESTELPKEKKQSWLKRQASSQKLTPPSGKDQKPSQSLPQEKRSSGSSSKPLLRRVSSLALPKGSMHKSKSLESVVGETYSPAQTFSLSPVFSKSGNSPTSRGYSPPTIFSTSPVSCEEYSDETDDSSTIEEFTVRITIPDSDESGETPIKKIKKKRHSPKLDTLPHPLSQISEEPEITNEEDQYQSPRLDPEAALPRFPTDQQKRHRKKKDPNAFFHASDVSDYDSKEQSIHFTSGGSEVERFRRVSKKLFFPSDESGFSTEANDGFSGSESDSETEGRYSPPTEKSCSLSESDSDTKAIIPPPQKEINQNNEGLQRAREEKRQSYREVERQKALSGALQLSIAEVFTANEIHVDTPPLCPMIRKDKHPVFLQELDHLFFGKKTTWVNRAVQVCVASLEALAPFAIAPTALFLTGELLEGVLPIGSEAAIALVLTIIAILTPSCVMQGIERGKKVLSFISNLVYKPHGLVTLEDDEAALKRKGIMTDEESRHVYWKPHKATIPFLNWLRGYALFRAVLAAPLPVLLFLDAERAHPNYANAFVTSLTLFYIDQTYTAVYAFGEGLLYETSILEDPSIEARKRKKFKERKKWLNSSLEEMQKLINYPNSDKFVEKLYKLLRDGSEVVKQASETEKQVSNVKKLKRELNIENQKSAIALQETEIKILELTIKNQELSLSTQETDIKIEELRLNEEEKEITSQELILKKQEKEITSQEVSSNRQGKEIISQELENSAQILTLKRQTLDLTKQTLNFTKQRLVGSKKKLEAAKQTLDLTKLKLEPLKQELEVKNQALEASRQALEVIKKTLAESKQTLELAASKKELEVKKEQSEIEPFAMFSLLFLHSQTTTEEDPLIIQEIEPQRGCKVCIKSLPDKLGVITQSTAILPRIIVLVFALELVFEAMGFSSTGSFYTALTLAIVDTIARTAEEWTEHEKFIKKAWHTLVKNQPFSLAKKAGSLLALVGALFLTLPSIAIVSEEMQNMNSWIKYLVIGLGCPTDFSLFFNFLARKNNDFITAISTTFCIKTTAQKRAWLDDLINRAKNSLETWDRKTVTSLFKIIADEEESDEQIMEFQGIGQYD